MDQTLFVDASEVPNAENIDTLKDLKVEINAYSKIRLKNGLICQKNKKRI